MKNKDVSLLNVFEYEQWYSLPTFNDAQRACYFDLSKEEKHIADSKVHDHVKLG